MIPRGLIAVLILACIALFAAMGMISWLHLMPGGEPILDARAGGYDAEAVARYFTALGPQGVAKYAGPLQALDTVFPALLVVTLALILLRTSRYWPHWSKLLFLLAPAGYGVMDYAENMLISDLLMGWQTPPDTATVDLASRFTVTKYVLLGATGLIWLGLMALRKRGR